MQQGQRPSEEAVNFLKSQGCGDIVHRGGRSLLTHLLGTHALISSWGLPDSVALAGMFHSIYGTSHFEESCLSAGPAERKSVRAVIGAEAERLAHLFSAMDRHAFLANPLADTMPNRLADEPLELRPGDAGALCDILLANELELAVALKGADRPDKIERKVGPWFEMINRHVSDAARSAYETAISGEA